jgi:hypothetical protein
MQHRIYDSINHGVSWPSQLWCVDGNGDIGDADELVVTTTMANIRMVAWRSRCGDGWRDLNAEVPK